MRNNKSETKLFYTLKELQDYIDTLNVLDNTKVYTIDVRDKLRDEYKPNVPEFNRHMKERVKQWCTARKLHYSEYEPVFTSSTMLLDDFNDWNDSNISHKLFIPLFKEVAKDGGTNLERTRLRVNGELEYGFIGVKINGCYSKQL
ncbi:tail length tape measure protein [Enterococcus phage vB_Efs30_KEN14]